MSDLAVRIAVLEAEASGMKAAIDALLVRVERGEGAAGAYIDVSDPMQLFRAACSAAGIVPDYLGTISEDDTAKLLGVKKETLKNQRSLGRTIPFTKMGKAARYRLSDLAAHWERNYFR